MTITPEQQKIVARTVEQLLEHFDAVQIFVETHDAPKDRTASYEHGGGNFYSRFGHILEWVGIQDQYQRQEAKRRDAKAQEDDDD